MKTRRRVMAHDDEGVNDDLVRIFEHLRKHMQPDEASSAEGMITSMMESFSGRRDMASDGRAAASVVQRVQAIRAAEVEVAPVVGEVLGMDSAAKVYEAALQRLGQPTAGLAAAAMRDVFQAVRGRSPKVAGRDAAADKAFAEMFPHANRIRHA